MGWINQGRVRPSKTPKDVKQAARNAAKVENLEYTFSSESVRDTDLPFISADIVLRNDGAGEAGRLCMFNVSTQLTQNDSLD